ncbi:hypothetical protein N9Y92_02645 [Chlamydiales bacterium]|nr:hypothetical protein [Chlamydiales bacterium]
MSAIQITPQSYFQVSDFLFETTENYQQTMDLAKGIFDTLGAVFVNIDCFKELSGVAGITKNMLSGTMSLSNVHTWFHLDKELKDCGSQFTKIGSLVGSHGANFIETVKLLDGWKLINLAPIAERLGSIPVFGMVTQLGLSYTKHAFSVFGAGMAITDSVLIINKRINTLGIQFHFVNLTKGGPFITRKLEGPVFDRSILLGITMNALKIALIVGAILMVTSHPVYYGLVILMCVASSLKMNDKIWSNPPKELNPEMALVLNHIKSH